MKILKKTMLIAGAMLLVPNAYAGTPDKVISAPHVYEFNQENPNKYWWCGQASLATVLQYSGYDKSMTDIHNYLKANNSGTYKENVSGCAGKYCSDINELKSAAIGLGMNKSAIVNVPTTSAAVLQKVKDAMHYDRALIFPGPLNLVDRERSSVGHFWVIVGYDDTGNPDQSTLYLKDVYLKSGSKWDREILVGKMVYRTVQWRKDNNYSQDSINFLIPKDGV